MEAGYAPLQYKLDRFGIRESTAHEVVSQFMEAASNMLPESVAFFTIFSGS